VEQGRSALESVAVTPAFWKRRRVLVTGHTGFKGAWLALWLARLGASTVGYALRPPTAPSLFELARVAASMRSIEGDIRDRGRLHEVTREAAPEIVFHLAAQSLVRQSYQDPVGTFEVNVTGTIHLLEACRPVSGVRAIVIVTSDKCYEESAAGSPHRETDPLGGHDPYAASKACAEIASAAYRRSFFSANGASAALATARSGNVIGGGDWAPDRLMTDLIGAFASGRTARLRNPGATRPWQHVLDPIAGYLTLAERLHEQGGRFAEAWNFGPQPSSAADVRTVADRVAALWGGGAAWEREGEPQPREAPILELDAAKARERLGWAPRLDLDAALAWTVSWYRSLRDGGDARELTEHQIERYMEGRVP
jgi:CDP-glucose 4,6-dehydratase